MEVFRHPHRRIPLASLWEDCGTSDRRDLLLACARLECALSDAWASAQGDADDAGNVPSPRHAWLALSLAAARLYLRPDRAAWRDLEGARRRLARQLPLLPRWLPDAEPEGFCVYGLRPDDFVPPAAAWRARHASPAWVLGLRTIGSTLGAVVAAHLHARFTTIRPRGPATDRRPLADAGLRAAVRAWPGAFLLVDEGPGISGSSLGGAVAWLRRLGVPAARIVIVSAWRPRAAALSNPYASRHWDRWQVWPAAPLPPPEPDAIWIGAGAWRRHLGRHALLPVWTAHERPKYLAVNGRTLWKFAGFASCGAGVAARSRLSARAGFGPPVEGFDRAAGWLALRREITRPWRPCRGWAEACGRYLAWVEANFLLARHAPPSVALRHMRAQNLAQLGFADAAEAPCGPLVLLDARMAAPEWGEAARGWIKFGGAEHADDPFFPGPADTAWDLAAVACEFGPALGAAVAAAYRRSLPLSPAGLDRRIHWHAAAYLAFRVAFCRLAAALSAAPDRTRFATAAAAYRRSLARLCSRPPA